MCQILNFRLTGRIDERRLSARQRRRHHQVFRGPHGDKREDYLGTDQAVRRPCLYIATVEINLRAKLLQSLEMKIDRSGADGTTTRLRDTRLAAPRQDRP